jgi:hypothetical protein
VAADNPAYVRTRRSGRAIEFRIAAAAPASARTTVDDLLACVRAAERTLGLERRRASPRTAK